MAVTRDDILKYIATLDPAMQAIFKAADAFLMEHDDTLTEDFQIAAEVVEMFWTRAKGKQNA